MSNTVNPEKLKNAPVASSCFMGLGQILYLKQYIRGALFALVEVVMLCCIIFGTKKKLSRLITKKILILIQFHL